MLNLVVAWCAVRCCAQVNVSSAQKALLRMLCLEVLSLHAGYMNAIKNGSAPSVAGRSSLTSRSRSYACRSLEPPLLVQLQ